MIEQVLLAGIVLGGVYALVASGLSLIFGVLRVINFAHGQFMMLGMYIVFFLNDLWHWPVYLTAVVVLPALFILGLLVERVAIEPIIGADASTHLLTTFGLGLMVQYAASILWSENPRSVSMPISHIVLGGLDIPWASVWTVVGALLAFLFLYLLLNRTRFGTMIRAVSQNPTSARLTGINVPVVNAVTFGLGIALVGVASVLLMPTYYVFPEIGNQFTVVAFITVILGGLGNVRGALLAGLVIGILETAFGTYISPSLAEALTFIVFVAILFWRPNGLFGQGARL